MSIITSTIPTEPGLSASSDNNTGVQILTLKVALKTLGPPPQGFLLFTDSDQHRCISMVGEREDRVDLDYDPKTGNVTVTRPIGRGDVEIGDYDFERKLKAQLVNLEPWAPRRPKLPLPERILLDVLGLLLAGPWQNLTIRCYIHLNSPTTAWEISPEGDYASVALTKRTLLIIRQMWGSLVPRRLADRMGDQGVEETAMRLLRPLRPVDARQSDYPAERGSRRLGRRTPRDSIGSGLRSLTRA